MKFQALDQELRSKLASTVRAFNAQGFSPATSTNYSLRSKSDSNLFWISKSGVDKSLFSENDFLPINIEGKIHPDFDQSLKVSAETELHLHLYQNIADCNCVIHTHSKWGTVLSMKNEKEKVLKISGLELLKGLEGNTTHEMTEYIPVTKNDQDMKQIISELNNHPHFKNAHGYLIAGHGLYTWGKSIEAAKRHIESFEFLFDCINELEK